MDDSLQPGLFYDTFHYLIESIGWPPDTIGYGRVEGDPEVIGQRWDTYPPAGSRTSPDAFYYRFGDNTFRKLLRYLYDHRQCSREELKKICGNEQVLDQHLAYMAQRSIVKLDGDSWGVSPRYENIKGIGKTLEWYVAEWFRFAQAPARHSVHIPEVADGGDLDVVAFLNGQKIFVECKSGNPANITETHLKLFLRRAVDFNPAIALLLIDTESKIDRQTEMLKKVYIESDLIKPDNFRLERWDVGCIHIQNTDKSIAHALRSALRSHSSNTNEDRPLIGLSSLTRPSNEGFASDEERNQWITETIQAFARSRGYGCIVAINRPYGEPVLSVRFSGDNSDRFREPLRTFENMSKKELEYWLHSHMYKV